MQVRAVMPFRNVFQSVPWGVAMHFLQWICHLTAMFLTEILYMCPRYLPVFQGKGSFTNFFQISLAETE